MTSSMTIGLVAYSVNPSMVFVRVPTERGRYVLTDRCVAEVPCEVCGATVGEPCRRGQWWKGRRHEWMEGFPGPPKHGAGTHARRRTAGRIHRGGSLRPNADVPKVRIAAEDFAAAQGEPEVEAVLRAIDDLISKARADAGAAPPQAQRTALARAQLLVLLGLAEPPLDVNFDVERIG